jgi:hypothetical protein
MQLQQLLNRRLHRLACLPPQLLRRPGSPFLFGSNRICHVIIINLAFLVVVISIIVEFKILEIELRIVSARAYSTSRERESLPR